eukprot:12022138-Karenia_brevis.AAC.1
MGYGIRFGGRLYEHALWADNLFLFNTQPSHLTEMTRSLSNNMRTKNCYWKLDSLRYLSPLLDSPRSIL